MGSDVEGGLNRVALLDERYHPLQGVPGLRNESLAQLHGRIGRKYPGRHLIKGPDDYDQDGDGDEEFDERKTCFFHNASVNGSP